MRNFVLTLTFVSSLLISFLPCRAQFNTVTRDTVPIRLIGQPAPTGKVGAVSGEEHGSAAVGSEGNTPLGSEEKFYEMPVMPGVGQGRGGGTQGKEGAVSQDGFHGLSIGAYGIINRLTFLLAIPTDRKKFPNLPTPNTLRRGILIRFMTL